MVVRLMSMSPAARALPVALLGLLIAGCTIDPCEGKTDQLASPEGLVVTENEHQAGWGSDSCLFCHPLDTTHAADCSEGLVFDMEAVREEAADGEFDTCAACHGDNGVQ